MKNDFPLKGTTVSLTINLEQEVVEKLKKMVEYSKFSESELMNTAIKRFIEVHSDFLPPKKQGART